MANQCTKFEVSSLSGPRDILGGLKIESGSCDVTMPLSGQFVIHRLGLAMINLYTKYDLSIFIHYQNMEGNAKCRNVGGLWC